MKFPTFSINSDLITEKQNVNRKNVVQNEPILSSTGSIAAGVGTAAGMVFVVLIFVFKNLLS